MKYNNLIANFHPLKFDEALNSFLITTNNNKLDYINIINLCEI